MKCKHDSQILPRSLFQKAWGCPRSARAWLTRVSSRASSLRGAQYTALDVRAHHSPRRASRPSRAPGPSARGACAARRWPAGTSGAPAATGSRCAWAARARRGRSAPPPRKVRGDRVSLRGALDIARRTIGGTPGRASASVHARASPAACRSTTASIHFHRASQVAKGTLGVESGRVPGSMTSHFFEDGFFSQSFLYTDERTRRARERARTTSRETDPKTQRDVA